MKIDLAIYTGEVGYDWHHAGKFSNDELIAYKRIIGKFPNPDFGPMPFGGAFNEGEWLVFYRYHYAKRWDNLGRDSLYVVLGRVPLAMAFAVDFKCVFALTEMSQPMKPFPTETTYIGPKASAAPSFASQRLFSGMNALPYLGSWFAAKPEGRLVVTIDGDYANPRITPRFEPTAKPIAPIASIPAAQNFGGQPVADWTPGGSGAGSFAVYPAAQTISWTACLVLSAGLFVLGCMCGYALRGWIGKDGSLGGKFTEKVTEMTGYEIKKVVPPKPETSAEDESRQTNGLPLKVEMSRPVRVESPSAPADQPPVRGDENLPCYPAEAWTAGLTQTEPMPQVDPRNVNPCRMVEKLKSRSDDSLKD